MTCSLCIKTDQRNKFVTGNNNFRLDAIQAHEVSTMHKNAKAICERPSVSQSSAGKALCQLKNNEYDRLSILFRNSHVVAKQHLSFTSFTWLCELDKAKGLDVGESYINDKKAAEFIHHISIVARTDIRNLLNSAHFVSFTCDGSSDSFGDEYESVYVRTSIKGSIQEKFLDVGDSKSSASIDIYNYLRDTFNRESELISGGAKKPIWDKIIGFCSDGASNMQGVRNGVAALVRADNPEAVVIHCLAHRLELSFKDATKKEGGKLYDKTITLLLGLYYMYRKGPKQKKALKRAFQALEMKKILPTRIGGTRWLPHMHRAIEVLLKGYRGYKAHLDNASHDTPKAEGLTKLLTDVSVVSFILMLKDIIAPLMKLSLYLQKREGTLADRMYRVLATKDLLLKVKSKTNQDIEKVITDKSYQGEPLKGRPISLSYQNSLIDMLITSLEKRFPSNDIVECSMLTSFRNWPPADDHEAILEFGDHSIHTIKKQMESTLRNAGVQLDEVDTEWAVLKSLVYQRFRAKIMDITLTWKEIFRVINEDIDNIMCVIDLLLSLPSTSVNNETTFSRTKLTKGSRRGHLKTETLSDLIVVELETASIRDFDPKPAIENWMITPSGRRRRVGYKRAAVQETESVSDDSAPILADTITSDESYVLPNVSSAPAEPVAGTSSQEDSNTLQLQENICPDDSDSDDEYDDESDSDTDLELSEDHVSKNIKVFLRDEE